MPMRTWVCPSCKRRERALGVEVCHNHNGRMVALKPVEEPQEANK